MDTQELLDRAQKFAARFTELTWLIAAPEIIADPKLWRRYVQEHALLQPIVELSTELGELAPYSVDFKAEVEAVTARLLHALDALQGKKKQETAMVQLSANSEQEKEFAQKLMAAYQEFSRHKGFEFVEKSGKNLGARITGLGAYETLADECGLHKMSGHGIGGCVAVLVYAVVEDVLDLQEKDIKIDTFRASGKGGQHVNKTESAVRLTHVPTAIAVVCQDERSQQNNRTRGLLELKKRVAAHIAQQNAALKDTAKQVAQKIITAATLARIYDLDTQKTSNKSATLIVSINKSGNLNIDP